MISTVRDASGLVIRACELRMPTSRHTIIALLTVIVVPPRVDD